MKISKTVYYDFQRPEGTTGSANITVVVEDGEGHQFTETFAVNVTEDEANGGPFLAELEDEYSTVGSTPLTIQMEAIDIEGDAVSFAGFANNSDELTVDVDENGLTTITPVEGFVGTSQVTLNIQQIDETTTQDPFDVQIVDINVLPGTPTIDLAATSDSGTSSSDNITNLSNLEFQVSGVATDALVEIVANDTVIGSATSTGATVTITTDQLADLGEGTYSIVARQTVTETTSEDSPPVSLIFDLTAPQDISSTAPTDGVTGEEYEYNAEHPEEGSTGFAYSLSNGPAGATIDPVTGVLRWTPTASQVGANSFGVTIADPAGNTTTQSVTVQVDSSQILAVRLQIVDENGQPVSAVAVGQEFQVNVLVEDLRVADSDTLLGVFAAYVDVNFDTDFAAGTGDIEYGANFPNGQFGTVTTSGLVDDAGATAGADPLGAGEFLLMSIPMIATRGGTLELTTDAADETPLLDSLLNGLTTPVPEEQIDFGTTSLQIVSETFAIDDAIDVLEDSENVAIRVLDNDIPIPITAVLSIDSVDDPTNGTATISSDSQTILYTPDSDFQGLDTFQYTLEDDAGNTSTATVSVTVQDVNDPPIANDDAFTIDEDSGSNTLNVVANDTSGPDQNETLSVLSADDAVNGTVTVSSDGRGLDYTPNANFSGTEILTYVVSDGRGANSTATATITVQEVNDPPTATTDRFSTNEDQILTLNVSDLLANDTAGPLETGQTISMSSVSAATNGSVSLNGDTITFTPDPDFAGTGAFEYTLQDNGTTRGTLDIATATGTVTITISNVNDNPTAVDDFVTAQSGIGSIAINVLANDSSAPDANETLSIASIGTPSNGGVATMNANGQIDYTPAVGFSGEETITYTISDGNGGTATATLTATVQNFVPGGISGFVFNDSDRDGIRDEHEVVLSGVKVSLAGTDDFGQSHSQTVSTNATGLYTFDQLPPGSYTVTQFQPAFTRDGSVHANGTATMIAASENSFTVELEPSGAEGTSFDFVEQGLEPKFSIWEALASSGRDGMYTSVDGSEGHQWSQLETGWAGVTISDIRFNANRTALTITINENGQELSATVSANDTSRLQVIGQEDDAYLVRIRGSRNAFDFQ